MSNLRRGTYGNYYGSYIGESEPLTSAEMGVNAQYIYSYLTNKGWTINAICGMLGNIQAESSMNPGRWQSEDVGNSSMGYGLVQWTPATKYIEWANAQSFTDYSEMDSNLARIIYEVENNLQWIATGSYNYSFKEFSTSNLTVSELAVAFLLNYERPADQSASVQAYRSSLAEAWYSTLTGSTPSTPDTPDTPSITRKRKKYNFILFNRRRREQWIR